MEITDVNRVYLEQSQLSVEKMSRGFAWLDTGSIEDFNSTSNFVAAIENRQGFKIGCLEEIALNNKWIHKNKIKKAISFYGNCEYSKYLNSIINK